MAVGTCCYYSLDFWKGASVSMDWRIPDHGLLTNLRTALLRPLLSHQTFLDRPPDISMWPWPLYQLFLPSLGPGVYFSSKGLRRDEVTVGIRLHCLEGSLTWKLLETQKVSKATAEPCCDCHSLKHACVRHACEAA